eukprot:4662831-Prymnesium_polylepis.1
MCAGRVRAGTAARRFFRGPHTGRRAGAPGHICMCIILHWLQCVLSPGLPGCQQRLPASCQL